MPPTVLQTAFEIHHVYASRLERNTLHKQPLLGETVKHFYVYKLALRIVISLHLEVANFYNACLGVILKHFLPESV